MEPTCQYRILWEAAPVGAPSGHIGITIYTENLSYALIFSAILRAISIGIKLLAPAEPQYEQNSANKIRKWNHERPNYPVSDFPGR